MACIRSIISFILCALSFETLFETIGSVNLLSSGVNPLGNDDIALIFYGTVKNNESIPYHVGLKMKKCCQFSEKGIMDCESMILHSDLSVELSPNEIRTLTMYYINMYLEGRNGTCLITLRWRSNDEANKTLQHGHQQFEIAFNTVLTKSNFLSKFGQDDLHTYSVCSSPDHDPRNGCKPVNCLIKYSGFRSFYNRTTETCEKSHSCRDRQIVSRHTFADEKMTTEMLSPTSNRCINLETSFVEESSVLPPSDTSAEPSDFNGFPIRTVCINGHLNASGICDCNPGWTSKELPSETINPILDTYEINEMCDIRTLILAKRSLINDTVDDKRNILQIILMILCLSALISLCSCIPIPIRIRRRKRLMYEGLQQPCECRIPVKEVDIVLEEVENRREFVSPSKRDSHSANSGQMSYEVNPTKPTNSKSNLNPQEDFEQQQASDVFEFLASNTNSANKELPRWPPRTSASTPYFVKSNHGESQKKIFLPQFSKSALIPLPAPLTSTKVNTPNQQLPKAVLSEFSESLPSESPSVQKLKCLLKEVEDSANQLRFEISEVTDGASNQSLDSFSAFNLQTPSLNQLSSATEFWENVTDSEHESECVSDQNILDGGFWVNRFQTDIVQVQTNTMKSTSTDNDVRINSHSEVFGEKNPENSESPTDVSNNKKSTVERSESKPKTAKANFAFL